MNPIAVIDSPFTRSHVRPESSAVSLQYIGFNMRISVVVAAVLAWSVLMTRPIRADDQFEGLSAYFEQSRKQWHVPALAVAIVRQGEVILSEGYGVCKVGSESRVTEDTVFPIASC